MVEQKEELIIRHTRYTSMVPPLPILITPHLLGWLFIDRLVVCVKKKKNKKNSKLCKQKKNVRAFSTRIEER